MKRMRLTREEEVELAKEIESGNTEARDRLIEANGGLVKSIAKKYEHSVVPSEDLVQAGMLGLIKAASKFDYRRGCKFSTYATYWIEKEIRQTVSDSTGFTGLPDYLKDNKFDATYADLCQKLQREPTTIEMADELNLSRKEVEDILNFRNGVVSMDAPIAGEQSETTFSETFVDHSVDIETELSNKELLSRVVRGETPLSAREAEVIRLDSEGMKGIEVAERLNISSARVTQISKTAKQKLRDYFSDFNLY